MKAEIVHNKKGEPRLVLTVETDEERGLLDGEPVLAPCVITRECLEEDDPSDEAIGPLVSMSFTFEREQDWITIDRIRALAEERGVPGPDVSEHPEDYDGECYCAECVEAMRAA